MLLQVENLSLSFGAHPLLDDISLAIQDGEKICLVGRNGAGKSTLFSILSGELEPDGGRVVRSQGTRVGYLKQDVPGNLKGSVYEIVSADSESLQPSKNSDANHAAEKHQRVSTAISKVGLDAGMRFEDLSAGLKRQVLFAQALAQNPEVLLLDEPTNHLDIPAITRMEELLLRFSGTLLFITHDRAFLEKTADRIIELDRGRISSWACGFSAYQQKKETLLDIEKTQNDRFDKKLQKEENWIRSGLKARRTRNEGRVRALQKMREAQRSRIESTGTVTMKTQLAQNSGKRVSQVSAISFSYDDRPLISNFSTTIMRRDKVGIIGPNGSGKTTLVRILVGELKPTSGTILLGTNLETAYYDQLRGRLDENRSVLENIGEGKEFITVNGKQRHVISYLKDFLFDPERARSPVRILSGGERNRLLLARLFTEPANLLILDEPTNDLDMDTLEILETLLVDYTGTLLLISHDRRFINNVVTSTLVFEGNGRIGEYVGGFDDWLRQSTGLVRKPSATVEREPQQETKAAAHPKKLGYMESRELASLPQQIELLEKRQAVLYRQLSDPSFYKTGGEQVAQIQTQLNGLETDLASAYRRWEELEDRGEHLRSSP